MEITKFSVFAKMLARENLHLRVDPKANTAHIDLARNIIVLPNWVCPDYVIRYIISHEVAHKLFTPLEKLKDALDRRIDQTITDETEKNMHISLLAKLLNIFEDHRIERLMLGKYPQLRNDYIRGQEHLMVDMDFFKFKENNETPDGMDIANKINYFSKIFYARKAKIPYSVTYDAQTTDFNDRMCKTMVYDDVIELSVELYNILKKEITMEGVEAIKVPFDLNAFKNQRITVTLDSFKDATEKMDRDKTVQMNVGYNYSYGDQGSLMSPIPMSEIVSTTWPENESYGRGHFPTLEAAHAKNESFVRSFCSFFETKKRGREYSRIQQHHTGMIDTNALHKYRYDDNIMKRNDVLYHQKNHAFFILVDCSGSMENIFSDVYMQITKFTKIAEKLKIPLFCYGFVDSRNSHSVMLYEFFNSLKSKEINKKTMNAIKDIRLTGTPLTPALYALRSVIENITKKISYDILNVMVITDGGDTSSWHTPLIQDKTTGMVVKTVLSPRDLEDNVGGALRIIKNVFNSRITYVDLMSGEGNLPQYLTQTQRNTFEQSGVARCKDRNDVDNILFVNLDNPLDKTLAKIFVDCLA